jgi:tripartite-type tricarboxylate transporter receptor subunit TctC
LQAACVAPLAGSADGERRHDFTGSVTRCLLLLCAFLAYLSCMTGTVAAAETYPTRPVRLIVPWPPGGIADLRARQIAERLTKDLGQPVVVDNRPGASGSIGVALGARAAPDGYTLTLISVNDSAIAPTLTPTLPYDALRDFEPVVQVTRTPLVLLANPSLNVRTLADLTALAKARPDQLMYASNGAATTHHVAGELLCKSAGIAMKHVPYKGAAPALMAMVAGHTPVGFDFAGTAAPHVQAGKLRALLVTGGKRVPLLPDVPSASEAGLQDLDAIVSWGGFAAPKGTPIAIRDRLNAAFVKALREPELKADFERSGTEPVGNSADEFAAFVKAEQARWARIIRLTGVKLDE